jgi:hypothetical protein
MLDSWTYYFPVEHECWRGFLLKVADLAVYSDHPWIWALPFAYALLDPAYDVIRQAWLYSCTRDHDARLETILSLTVLDKHALEFLRSEWENHQSIPLASTLLELSGTDRVLGNALPEPVLYSYTCACMEEGHSMLVHLHEFPCDRAVDVSMEELYGTRSVRIHEGSVLELACVEPYVPNKSGRPSTHDLLRNEEWAGAPMKTPKDKPVIPAKPGVQTTYDMFRLIQDEHLGKFWAYHPPLRLKYVWLDPEIRLLAIPDQIHIPWECLLESMHEWVMGTPAIRSAEYVWGSAIVKSLVAKPSQEMSAVRKKMTRGAQGFSIQHSYVLAQLGAWMTFCPGRLSPFIRAEIARLLPLTKALEAMQFWYVNQTDDPVRFLVWRIVMGRVKKGLDKKWLEFLWVSVRSTWLGPSTLLIREWCRIAKEPELPGDTRVHFWVDTS